MRPHPIYASFLAAILISIIGTAAAFAEFTANYSPTKFKAAQSENLHIVIEVFKQGCGTCKAQQPSLEAARAKFPDAVFLKFDFANDEAAVKQFEVVKQSTIIVFKGTKEVARLVGETDREKIVSAISKGA